MNLVRSIRNILLIGFWIHLSLGVLTSQSLKMDTYGEDHGLTGHVVYDIIQGPEGRIWAITDKALNFFDGQKWDNIKSINAEKLPNTKYSRLHYDSINKTVYVLGYSLDNQFRIFFYKNKSWKSLSSYSKNIDFINSVLDENNQKIYIVSTGGDVNILDLKSYEWLNKCSIGSDIININIYDGHVVLYTANGAFKIFNQDKYIRKKLFDLPNWKYGNVSLIVNDKIYKNQVIVFQKNKLYRADNKTFNISHIRNIGIKSTTDMQSFLQVHQTKNDNLYIISEDQFFITSGSGETEIIYSTDFDNEQWLNRFFVDRDGVVWLGSNKGIKKIDSFKISNFDKKNGILKNEITAINQFNNGDVFLGLVGNYQILNSNTLIDFDINKTQTPFKRILSTFKDNNKDLLYFAGNRSGLHKIDKNYKVETLVDEPNSVSEIINKNDTLFYVKNNSIIVKSYNKIYDEINLKNNYVRKLYYKDKLIGLSNRGVIDIYTNENIYSGLKSNQNLTLSTYSITPFNNGYLIGTLGGLIYWNGYNDDDNKLFQIDGKYLDISVYTSMYDRYGRLWLGTNKGVYIINEKFTNFRIINTSDGLLSNEINRGALKEMQNGDVYIGTDKGLSIYRPKFDETNINSPEASIAYKEEHDFIKNNTKHIFRILIPYYFDIQSHRIKYRLNGFDNEFTEISRDKLQDIIYTNLNEGKYQFEVQVKHKNSDWSPIFYSEQIIVASSLFSGYFNFIVCIFLTSLITAFLMKRRASKLHKIS